MSLSITELRVLQNLGHRVTNLEMWVADLYAQATPPLTQPPGLPPASPIGLEPPVSSLPVPPSVTAAIAGLSEEQKALVKGLLDQLLSGSTPATSSAHETE